MSSTGRAKSLTVFSARNILAFLATMLLLACMFASPTQAQAPANTVGRPTMFTRMPQTMGELIAAGYQVINVSTGLGGFAYLLKQGDKWVTCAVQPTQANMDVFVSECRAMN